jgi:uncharacterized protein (TIGR02646 family)
MIHIRRPDKPPAALNSVAVANARKKIKEIAAKRKPMSDEFPTLWGNKEVRQALWDMQGGKCAYCERRRDVNRESDIDHFRPKAEVTQPPGAPTHKGYWWLAYDWKNLLFSCRHCNQQYKLKQFPVPDEGKRVKSEAQPLQDERGYLIDPCSDDDDPESCFIYHVDPVLKEVHVVARPKDKWNEERAKKTIEVLGLDRADLRQERSVFVKTLKMLVEKMYAARYLMKDDKVAEAADEIRKETHSSLPFAGFRRAYFRERELGDYISKD